jgi:ABC-type phosphate transport system substrate-binding protein
VTVRRATRQWVLRPGLLLVAVCLIVSEILLASPAGAIGAPVSGGGSGFAALEIDQWRADTARAPYSLKVNYVSQGSSFGREQFIESTLDFGVSDITFQPSEMADLRNKRCGGRAPQDCFDYVPVSAGGLAFMYNLVDDAGNRVSNLQLTRRAACKIFTGAISRWNDPEIVATNPQLAGFARDIIPIIRSDGAGESFVFSQFCIAVAHDVWQAFIADRVAHDPANVADDFRVGSPVSNWPGGFGRSTAVAYADGTANAVADDNAGKDAITYVAAGYAKVRSFPVASLQNAAGVFTQPDEDNVTVALGYAKPNPDPAAVGTFILDFGGLDPRAYFPSTYSYVIAQTTGFDPQKGAALGTYLCYSVSLGQVIAPRLRYARLSSVLVQISIAAISKIPGAPPANQCFVAGAPPPPPPPSLNGGTLAGTAGRAGGAGGAGPAGSGSAANSGAAGGASATTPCAPSASSSTTTSTKPGASTTSTPTTKPANGGTTTTTTKPAAATTTTTAPCATGASNSSANSVGGASGPESVDLKLAAAAAGAQNQSSDSTGSDAWLVLLGALVCAAGSAVLSWSRGRT